MKIAVYGICLNEEAHAREFVETARDADLVQVADTGSMDGTVAALEAAGAIVRHIRIDPWRFDEARNAALALLPEDIDICVSLDLDSRLSPGWRQALEAAWTPGANRAYFIHVFGVRPNGAIKQFLDNRIHARHGVRWKYPCHECLVVDGVPEQGVFAQGLVMEQAEMDKPRRRTYLPLLELGAREDPNDARPSHMFARELASQGRPREAIAEFQRYLTLTPSSPFERNMSLRYLAAAHLGLDERDEAVRWYRLAAEEQPTVRGAWIDLACALYQAQDWAGCLEANEKAMAADQGDSEYGAESESGAMPEDMASVCAWRVGRHQDAVAYARRAAALAPGVERLRANLAAMEQALAKAAAS